ncbi:hypothetical protein OYT88_15565 [Sporolactobacillus sp. CQH2019]|uniref:hypothetical protein n=1 Tax=Sporolactobacillus sp. CQH2019 TaxID=3023512 RepID=UPI002368A68E|nr:hypothetical protein [Sporolactobacillus sp. CQH2019]MDD9149969.1 hypothetical protein [Sporolactobacillus sp. CQH2019]
MQLTDAATGMSLISGRNLSTEERVTKGVFGVLDVIPAFKAAGAFSAIDRMGTKGVTTLGDLQPEFAGAESIIQDVKSTFRQTASKESVNP